MIIRAEEFVNNKAKEMNGLAPTKNKVIDWMVEFSKDELELQTKKSTREIVKGFLEHYESTVDFLPTEPSILIDSYIDYL